MTEEAQSPSGGEMPPPTPFQLLCGSLAAQVHMALGLMPDPIEHKVHLDLGAARQGIDLLAMLEEKTTGNLDEEEAKMLGQILAQLRVLYVERAKQPAAEPASEAASDAEPSPSEPPPFEPSPPEPAPAEAPQSEPLPAEPQPDSEAKPRGDAS